MAGTSGDVSLQNEDNSDKEEFIPGYKDMNDFTTAAFKSVMGAIKASNDLPSSGDDFDYYSSFDSFRTLMDIEGSRILQLMQKVMRYHGARGNLASNAEVKDTEEKYDVLVDANDQLLERVGNFLDEAAGLRKQETPLVIVTSKSSKTVSGSWNKKTPPRSSSSRSNFRLLAARNIQRPQLRFKDKIDNSARPFVPRIKIKPNALKPLTDSLQIDEQMDEDLDMGYQLPHPYQYELDNWTPLQSQMEAGTIREPSSLDEIGVSMVSTEDQLRQLLDVLRTQQEIAIDVEHHSYRTFQGITCLMQISTRRNDFIVDTLELRNELHILNQVFTDPAVVKVFHGADMDIEWLQRDLGLYIVNMFDTGQAARVLNLQRFSLAHLLATYCQIEADKQFQLADWRIRPLPEELVRYARQDTHYLLYIYDKLRTELIDQGNNQNNLLTSVLQRSTTICAKTYKKSVVSPDDYMGMYHRTKKMFNSQQLSALKGLFAWRDGVARVEDESLSYVLPNHMLMQICEVVPREPQGILACCNPIPPLVRQNLMDMHHIVKEARDTPLVKVQTTPRVMKPTKYEHPKYNVSGLLHCPHDMSHRDKHSITSMDVNVPVAKGSSLFKDTADIHLCHVRVKESPILAALGCPQQRHQQMTEARRKAARIRATFSNPIEKFLPMDILKKNAHTKTDPKKLGMIDEKWKLLPHTSRPVPKTTEAPVPEQTLESGDVIPVDMDDQEDVISIREQYYKPKKRVTDDENEAKTKKSKTENHSPEVTEGSNVEDGSKSEKKKKKKKKGDFLAPQEDFKAYDYSVTDYGVFSKSEGTSSSKQYDPHAGSPQAKRKGGSKHGKGYSGSGKKSMTYSKGSSHGAAKIQWPKR